MKIYPINLLTAGRIFIYYTCNLSPYSTSQMHLIGQRTFLKCNHFWQFVACHSSDVFPTKSCVNSFSLYCFKSLWIFSLEIDHLYCHQLRLFLVFSCLSVSLLQKPRNTSLSGLHIFSSFLPLEKRKSVILSIKRTMYNIICYSHNRLKLFLQCCVFYSFQTMTLFDVPGILLFWACAVVE